MKVTKGTIIRTVVLALALINQILTATGKGPIPVADADVEVLISTAWTVIAAAAAWWKNNSFTGAALEGDAVMRNLKW
jgi:SPP1 family holin